MNRRQLALLAITGGALLSAGRVAADDAPTTWDGLVRVPSKKLKFVYLAPGADFRSYTKVMIDPTEIAFDKKWLQQYNQSVMPGSGAQVTSYDIKNDVAEGVKRAASIFDTAFTDGGYPVVAAAAPDVLRVRTAIMDIIVAAPDILAPGQGHVYANTSAAGAATFVVEARDSQSNALLGRAVDSRLAGEDGILRRDSVTNWSDFSALAKTWGRISVAGLNELKTLSPVAKPAAPAG